MKETNPKDALGVSKSYQSVIPRPVLHEIGAAMMEGARKYGSHNYRVKGVTASVYYNAAMRHLDQWWEGENIDEDSHLSHVTKAMACLTVLRDCMMQQNWVDDRPPAFRKGWMVKANANITTLIEKYPTPVDMCLNK